MASVGTNKRRRTNSNTLTINDLPIGFLVDVSSYLCKPSRAIFAVAISGSSSSQKKVEQSISDSSKAIIAASDWDTLDFADIEKNLAERLIDDDLYAILCIAIQNLRILKLTYCTNIIGHGLKPLQSSNVLELIDLSLIGKYERQWTVSEDLMLSQRVVLPIFSTNNIRRTLKYVQFPHNWHVDQSAMYLQFKRSFVNDFQERNHTCSHCNRNVNEQAEEIFNGHQHNVCYSCLKVICDDCERDDGLAYLVKCYNCRKHYCAACTKFVSCRSCGFYICSGCKMTCQGCENDFCQQSCLSDCDCQRMQNLLQAHW